MNACDNCPNRSQADTLDALAVAVEAIELLRPLAPVMRARAEAIRAAGCRWWWYIEGERPGEKPHWECGAENLPIHVNAMGGLNALAARTVQEDRNEQRRALESIQAAAAQYGAGEILQACAGIGLLTAQSSLQKANGRPELLPETAAEGSDG